MTLQSSGQISIAQMRDEYLLGNPISMSGFYGKNGLPGSGQIKFSDFYGKSNMLDQQTVTVAQFNAGFTSWGFRTGNGVCSDGTSNIFGGAQIIGLYVILAGSNYLRFYLSGTYPNSGWTRMNLNGVDYYRVNASQVGSGGGVTTWEWDIGKPNNPFGTVVGAQRVITWY